MGPQFGHNAQREVSYATDRASEHLPGRGATRGYASGPAHGCMGDARGGGKHNGAGGEQPRYTGRRPHRTAPDMVYSGGGKGVAGGNTGRRI